MEGLAVNIEIVVAMGLFHREKEGRTDPRHPAHRGAQAAGSGQTGPLEKDEDRLSIWKAAVAHLHLRGSEPLARRFCGQIFPRSTYLYISLGIRSDAMKSRELWISLFLTARGVGALRANSVLARRNSLLCSTRQAASRGTPYVHQGPCLALCPCLTAERSVR